MFLTSSFHRVRSATSAVTLAARHFSATARANTLARMTVVGRLGDTPELVTTSTGKDLVRYVVAVNYGPDKTSWFRVAAFPEGNFKDFMLGIPKGSMVCVEANAQMVSVDGEDGKPRSFLNLFQRSIDVLQRRKPDDPSVTAEMSAASAAA